MLRQILMDKVEKENLAAYCQALGNECGEWCLKDSSNVRWHLLFFPLDSEGRCWSGVAKRDAFGEREWVNLPGSELPPTQSSWWSPLTLSFGFHLTRAM
jgi:hypothetical protein